ncbi:hypothetical protein ACIU1J_32310 [Azospirillum doebereinerae]|uniref:hypothetical protein n=1 Tax=Azospirillum doebereinerae TaxID=92933 RepID=UPI001EE51B79|nr:hypothetical protein [Azospirillum doebereinerae]MCG5238374.1 hypothetical protein [Azospirillum doebereinerae]
MMSFRMATLIPARKVWAGGLAGVAAATIGTLLRQYLGLDIPAELIAYAVTGFSSAVAYLVPPAARDAIARADTMAREFGNSLPPA